MKWESFLIRDLEMNSTLRDAAFGTDSDKTVKKLNLIDTNRVLRPFSSFFFFFLSLYLCSKCNSFLGMLSCKSLLCTILLQKFSVSAAVMCTMDDATTI